MTMWELFVGALDECLLPLSIVALLVCLVGLIRELTKGQRGKGG